MRCARAEGMGECAKASFSDITAGVPFTVLRRFHLTSKSYYGSAYCVGGTGTFCRRQNFAHITCDVTHSSLRDTFPSQHLTFGQVRKALLRIKILCHPNMGSAKSNFDHRNSHFAATLAAGAATLAAGAGTFTVGVKMNSDHPNSFSRQLRRRKARSAHELF